MASYAGPDRGIDTRLAFWSATFGTRNAAEITADDVAAVNGPQALTVDGNAGDLVDLQGGGWTQTADNTLIGGIAYAIYTHLTEVQVRVRDEVIHIYKTYTLSVALHRSMRAAPQHTTIANENHYQSGSGDWANENENGYPFDSHSHRPSLE